MVTAKMTCTKAEDGQIELSPVVDGSEENKQFYKYTPGGLVQLSTVNESAAAYFEPGKQYYVRFEAAA